MGSRVYIGRSARNRREPLVYSCPCGERYRVEAWRAVDSSDAAALKLLTDGGLNRVTCPSCGAGAELQVPVVYHDLEAPRLVLVLPDSLRHRELEERARFCEALAADREPPPLYVLDAPVVFGAVGLRAILAPPPSPSVFLPTPTGEAVVPPRSAPVSPLDAPAPTVAINIDPTPSVPSSVEVTLPRVAIVEPRKRRARSSPSLSGEDSDQHTRVRVQVPDPRSAMIERWIAGREGPTAFLIDDKVLVCAALPPLALECLVPGPLELRIQLHRLPAYPLLSLAMVAPQVGATAQARARSDADRVLTVPLDVARAAHRVVLDGLGKKARVTCELYDADYLPVVTHHVEAPLEENVRLLAQGARDALERLSPASRSFERARAILMAPGYDRLGRTPIDLPDDELEPLERPGAVLAALGQVARWSEPSAEAYLLEIGSVPLPVWRSKRARVIRRALDVGIAVPRPLVERSSREHASPLPSWPELLALQVRRFAEVSARVKPNDLSAAEEADNWQSLLHECGRAGVTVDDGARQLAQAALKRARAGTSGGVDLRTLDTGELEALLERRELRREAALILCERHETPTLPTLFSAIRRMPRGECNVVLPAVTGFGPAAEKWLIEGLKSRRSFMRQGCALGLGALKSPLAVDALTRLLLFEPTEIWPEVARALGDVGAQAVMPLAGRLREVDPKDHDRRERVIAALAQIVSRGVKSPVEMLTSGRDAVVAQAAQRALALAAEVRAADEAVRKGNPAEQTVVRGFSRRFYDALGGSIELDPSDLEELDELDGDEAALSEEPDDSERTANDLPALVRSTEENTNPTPKSSLPRTVS